MHSTTPAMPLLKGLPDLSAERSHMASYVLISQVFVKGCDCAGVGANQVSCEKVNFAIVVLLNCGELHSQVHSRWRQEYADPIIVCVTIGTEESLSTKHAENISEHTAQDPI